MSTVKATHFEHPSASSPGITLGSDGSVVLPSGFTGGLGTNVVQTVKTDAFSTTSTSYTDITGLSVTITPTSASSKIAVVFTVAVSTAAGALAFVRLNRDGTDIFINTDATVANDRATFYAIPNSALVLSSGSGFYVDSPATTSPVTYKLRMLVPSATGYVNRRGDNTNSGAVSHITAIEVAA